jgi:two-component system OmpR family sensor kinase
MKHSLERHLSRTLGLAIVLTGLLAGAVAFGFAYMDAQAFQDDTLKQIAALADGGALHGYADKSAIANIDPEVRIRIMDLSSGAKPAWLPEDMKTGFHTLDSSEGDWRVYVRQTDHGTRIAAAQATEARNEIAINSALRTLTPLLVLLPLLVWLAVRIVRGELGPLRRLAQTLDERSAEYPEALSDVGLPYEIVPFVHAINRQMERIRRLMGQQRRFIADAAHELRTPLTALSLQAQNLEQASTQDAMRSRVAPLRAGIERARRLTEQLLNLARSQDGTRSPQSVDVSKMARELIAECLPLAEAKEMDLGLEDPGGMVLFTEAETLRLVLKNALDNALRYTPAGGEITLRMYSEGADAVIEVQDSGPGIPVKERERVFDPFYRIEGAPDDGSGLGLAIARDAAARLGGTVSLHDGPRGAGLVFRYRQRHVQ